MTRLSSCIKANITIRSDVDVVLSEEATKEVVTQASGDAPTDAVAKLFARQAGVGSGAEGVEKAEIVAGEGVIDGEDAVEFGTFRVPGAAVRSGIAIGVEDMEWRVNADKTPRNGGAAPASGGSLPAAFTDAGGLPGSKEELARIVRRDAID